MDPIQVQVTERMREDPRVAASPIRWMRSFADPDRDSAQRLIQSMDEVHRADDSAVLSSIASLTLVARFAR